MKDYSIADIRIVYPNPDDGFFDAIFNLTIKRYYTKREYTTRRRVSFPMLKYLDSPYYIYYILT